MPKKKFNTEGLSADETPVKKQKQEISITSTLSQLSILAKKEKSKIQKNTVDPLIKDLFHHLTDPNNIAILKGENFQIIDIFKNFVNRSKTVPFAKKIYENTIIKLIIETHFLELSVEDKISFCSDILLGNRKQKIEGSIHCLHASFLTLCSTTTQITLLDALKEKIKTGKSAKQIPVIQRYLEQPLEKLIQIKEPNYRKRKKADLFDNLKTMIDSCSILATEFTNLLKILTGEYSSNKIKLILKAICDKKNDLEQNNLAKKILFLFTKILITKRKHPEYQIIFDNKLLNSYLETNTKEAVNLFTTARLNQSSITLNYLASQNRQVNFEIETSLVFLSATEAFTFFQDAFKSRITHIFNFTPSNFMNIVKTVIAQEPNNPIFLEFIRGVFKDVAKVAILSNNITRIFDLNIIDKINDQEIKVILTSIYNNKNDDAQPTLTNDMTEAKLLIRHSAIFSDYYKKLGRKRPSFLSYNNFASREINSCEATKGETLHISPLETPSPLSPPQAAEIFSLKINEDKQTVAKKQTVIEEGQISAEEQALLDSFFN